MFDIACGFDLAELMHYGQLHNPIAYKALTNQLNHLHSQFYPHEAIKNDRPLYDRLRLGYPGLSRIHNFGSVGIPVARPDGRSSVAQSSAIPDKFGMMKGMLKPFQAPITSVGSNNAFGIIPLDERAMNYLLYRRLIVSCPISKNTVSNITRYVIFSLIIDKTLKISSIRRLKILLKDIVKVRFGRKKW